MLTKAIIGVSAAVAVAALCTASADAKPRKIRVQPYSPIAAPAYGTRMDGRRHSANPSHDVYVNGRYSGSDPDPFIRSQLAHDPPWANGDR